VKTCETCKWCHETKANAWWQCRRYAPRPMENLTDDWPFVNKDGWCGEYEPKSDVDDTKELATKLCTPKAEDIPAECAETEELFWCTECGMVREDHRCDDLSFCPPTKVPLDLIQALHHRFYVSANYGDDTPKAKDLPSPPPYTQEEIDEADSYDAMPDEIFARDNGYWYRSQKLAQTAYIRKRTVKLGRDEAEEWYCETCKKTGIFNADDYCPGCGGEIQR